jgi:hypothetical protein
VRRRCVSSPSFVIGGYSVSRSRRLTGTRVPWAAGLQIRRRERRTSSSRLGAGARRTGGLGRRSPVGRRRDRLPGIGASEGRHHLLIRPDRRDQPSHARRDRTRPRERSLDAFRAMRRLPPARSRCSPACARSTGPGTPGPLALFGLSEEGASGGSAAARRPSFSRIPRRPVEQGPPGRSHVPPRPPAHGRRAPAPSS